MSCVEQAEAIETLEEKDIVKFSMRPGPAGFAEKEHEPLHFVNFP